MKRITIACIFVLFTPTLALSSPNCVNITTELDNGKTEKYIINRLTEKKCGMSLKEADDAIMAAGGDENESHKDTLNKLLSESGGGGDVAISP